MILQNMQLIHKAEMTLKKQKMWESFGDEGSELNQQFIPLLCEREKIEFWFRRDLSFYKE